METRERERAKGELGPCMVSSGPEAQNRPIRQAQITHTLRLVGSEKCGKRGQITTCTGQAWQRTGSAELTEVLCGNPSERQLWCEREATGPRMDDL